MSSQENRAIKGGAGAGLSLGGGLLAGEVVAGTAAAAAAPVALFCIVCGVALLAALGVEELIENARCEHCR